MSAHLAPVTGLSSSRARSQAAFAALAVESGAAAGLVSVSTKVSPGVPVPVWWAEHCITIDREMARVVRLRKGVGVSAKALHNAAGWKPTMVMVTLTYAGDNRNWAPHQIGGYIRAVRQWYTRLTGDALRYVWVAELQERGVIHYHAVFWLRKGVTMPKADKRGWWPHGMTKTERAVKPIGYLMSYLSKIESKNIGSFPHGARIFGVGGLDQTGRDCKRWVLWPAYVQGNAAAGERWKPREGGGYLNHDDGRILLAEFAPTGAGFSNFIRVRTTPREIDACGPFSWAPTYATVH